MTILFDQGTPVPLRKHLPQHTVMTAYECGWAALKNGDLLREAEENEFAVLVTTDQNLKYQQQLSGRRLAILVLGSTSWPRIRQHSEAIRQVVEQLTPGTYHEFPIP